MLRILQHPNPILHRVSEPVIDFSIIRSLIDPMAETMYAGEGVGLAAPQIGLSQRLVMIDHTAGDDGQALKVMINPVIESMSLEKDALEESCLSIPNIKVIVPRSLMIHVKYFDVDGCVVTEKLSGFEARIAQHEIDHLNGVTLLNRIKRRR